MEHCSSCGSPLRAGSRFCVKCGQPVQSATVIQPVPSALGGPITETAQIPMIMDKIPVMLKIVMEQHLLGADHTFDVYLDQNKVVRGSFTTGIATQTATTVGRHVLTMVSVETILPRKWKLSFVVSQGGEHTAVIKFNQMWGTFKLTIK